AIVPDCLAFVEEENIAAACQFESADATTIQLRGVIEGEDVVLRGDVAAVMCKQAAVLTAVDQVLLDQQVMASFVRVDPPPAVISSRDIVNHVEANPAARRAAG